MAHLGSRVTALVDGQLPAAETEMLLGHAAACADCQRLLRQERASRSMLSDARDVEPDPGLTARLIALDAILDALPAGDYDTSMTARLGRGWRTVTEWALDAGPATAAADLGGDWVHD